MGRRSKEEWAKLCKEQKESGLSQAAFCQERGISLSSFRWRNLKEDGKRKETPYVELTVPVTRDKAALHEGTLTLPGGVTFQMKW